MQPKELSLERQRNVQMYNFNVYFKRANESIGTKKEYYRLLAEEAIEKAAMLHQKLRNIQEKDLK